MSPRASWLRETLRVAAPVLILAAGVGGFWVFGRPTQVPQQDANGPNRTSVRTAAVRAFEGPLVIERDGVTVPIRQVTLAAEVEGRIRQKAALARAGNRLVPDTFLFQIDDTDYILEVDRLSAQLRQADEDLAMVDVDWQNTEALIRIAQRDLELERRQLGRIETLVARDAASEGSLEQAQRQELAAQNTLQTLENQLTTLQQKRKTLAAARDLVRVQLQQAQHDKDRTMVTAPLAGTVVTDYVEENDYVKRGDPLVRISDTSTMEVKCNLRIDDLVWLWHQHGDSTVGESLDRNRRHKFPQGQVDIVYAMEGREFVWSGRLDRYEGIGMDPATRTVPCRVVITQPDRVRIAAGDGPVMTVPMLFSGMYVKLRIPVQAREQLLEIPDAALQPGNQVWVVRDGRLRVVNVRVARVADDRVLLWPDDSSAADSASAPSDSGRRASEIAWIGQQDQDGPAPGPSDNDYSISSRRRPRGTGSDSDEDPPAGQGLCAGERVIISPLAATVDGMLVRDVAAEAAP